MDTLNESMDKLLVTPEGYRRLKAAYEKAASEGRTIFNFEDVPLVTQYAFYLLAYLRSRFDEAGVKYE